jgi:integrase/recombinase XerD
MLLTMQGPRDPRYPFRHPGAHLWISGCGMPLTAAALQKILARHTTARFGHSVNTHLFRDCAATSVASDDPEHVRISAQLLEYSSFKTTERHYIVANMRSASDRYHDIIESIRADARQHRSPP